MRCNALIPLILILIAAPGLAAAQSGAQSIDDLLRQARPGPGLTVDDPVIRPDGEPTAEDRAYERRVLEAFRAAQNRAGALDGRWQVQTLQGQVLYLLMFNDPNAGDARIDGAWANPRTAGATNNGFVESVARDGQDLTITFRESGAAGPATRLQLSSNGAGGWRGQAGSNPVVMFRAEGIETMALGQ